MGDTEYDYFDDEAFAPRIHYYDANEQEYSDEETLLAQGVKLIGFEYPTPIENSFVFSHLSYFSHTIVLPVLLIALLALVAIMIFERKEKERKYKAVDIISIILNFIVSFIFIPIVLLFALLIDIEGGGPELYYQVLYFLPSFSVLCIAASVALRRKGYGVKSLITGLMGPMAFAVYLIVFVLCDLL
jgi:phosphoglycerol transferase MdoB-like AlkP superfamily enzyme